ncbi:hypothetical protein VQ042_21880 [Aurantimonas sp. A2-1-M11]|uniref:hypothetical protein n=1 Tax=Aurantimonas sp. A2-1-M11 TaxID=3113712 RepID=UPI002F91F8A1
MFPESLKDFGGGLAGKAPRTARRRLDRVLAGILVAAGVSMITPAALAHTADASDAAHDSFTGLAPNQVAHRIRVYCHPPEVGQVYLEPDKLAELRTRFETGWVARIRDFSEAERSTIQSAFAVGPEGGFFAARLLRTLSIVAALEDHVVCLSRGNRCLIGDQITHFRNPSPQPGHWDTMYWRWRGFLERDAMRATMCLGM